MFSDSLVVAKGVFCGPAAAGVFCVAMRATAFFIVAVGLTVSGCGSSYEQASFDSSNPDSKIRAIANAAKADDRGAIHDLIEQLLSEDALVRSFAIDTLEDMTGETFGYRSYDDAADRREAIDRWVEAYRSGALDSKKAAQTAASE